MKLICPECKNEVDFFAYPNLAVGNVIECNVCGITLLVNKMDANEIVCEVADEEGIDITALGAAVTVTVRDLVDSTLPARSVA